MHPRVTLPTALAACAAVTSSRWEHCKACQCCELPVHGAAPHFRSQCPGRRPAPRRTCSCAALPMRSATGAPRPAPAAPPAPLPTPHAPARALRTHSATRVRARKGSGKPIARAMAEAAGRAAAAALVLDAETCSGSCSRRGPCTDALAQPGAGAWRVLYAATIQAAGSACHPRYKLPGEEGRKALSARAFRGTQACWVIRLG